MCRGSDNEAIFKLHGREFNLKLAVNPREPTKLSEFVKTRNREKLLWGSTHERINDTFHDLPAFFLSVSVMLTYASYDFAV